MKALSIRQPWAFGIVIGIKPVENRNWSTAYRGPLAIHASKEFDGEGARAFAEIALSLMSAREYMQMLDRAGVRRLEDLPRGGIVGTAILADCVTAHDSPWFFGRFGFVISNPQPAHFTPRRGALGLFETEAP